MRDVTELEIKICEKRIKKLKIAMILNIISIILIVGFVGGYIATTISTHLRITKLEQYKTSTEPIISGLNDEIVVEIENKLNYNKLQVYISVLQEAVIGLHKERSGLNDEIKELRDITDEFRAQIKGLQKEVLIGIQEGGM